MRKKITVKRNERANGWEFKNRNKEKKTTKKRAIALFFVGV